ncbi:TPA: hypothetical protein PXN43_003195 [Yersinia enterocolitica]|nr:hypothetical protein [Yersinia enterocolitica]
MEYELYNNHEVHEFIVLLDVNIINVILNDYNDDDELLWMKNNYSEEPKSIWISPGMVFSKFNVPLLDINYDNEIRVIDGRHRICWMKEKGMDKIPIAITKSVVGYFQKESINLEMITTLDMPCSVKPNLQNNVESEPWDAYQVIKRLVTK